jgi:uncharacterized protein YndB with AHSA1/START domain
MRLTGRTPVARPPQEVFALWADLERSPEYSSATIERRKVTSGPVSVGTRYHAVDRWPGRTMAFTVEVTAYEPPRRMAASWSEPMAGGWEAQFDPASGGTDLTFTTRIEASGLMGLLTPLMRPWASRQLRRFMVDFRRWAETQPKPAAGSPTIEQPLPPASSNDRGD